MNKGGVGVGSASIVLIFAVLCLTVFSLISFVVAGNDKILVETESKFVLGYYEADALAERVLAELLEAGPYTYNTPGNILGVDINCYFDEELWADVWTYSCPLSENKEIYVKLAMYDDAFDVLSWRMRDTGEWEADLTLNLFDPFGDSGAPMWDMGAPLWDTDSGSMPWENADD